MNITSVSRFAFTGKSEIQAYAKEFPSLTKEEKYVEKLACSVWDIKPTKTSDGDYLDIKDDDTVNKYIDALDKMRDSKFAYLIAVDTLSADAFGNYVESNKINYIRSAAVRIAENTPSVTKEEVLKHIGCFA